MLSSMKMGNTAPGGEGDSPRGITLAMAGRSGLVTARLVARKNKRPRSLRTGAFFSAVRHVLHKAAPRFHCTLAGAPDGVSACALSHGGGTDNEPFAWRDWNGFQSLQGGLRPQRRLDGPDFTTAC